MIVGICLFMASQTICCEDPSPRSVENLRHWLDDEACLARDKTQHLKQTEDLMDLKSAGGHEAPKFMQNLIEEALI